MRFNVKIGEKSTELCADEEASISTLKANVERFSGIPSENQKWIYQGRVLADSLLIKDTGIIEGNTVLVIKVASSKAASQSDNYPRITEQNRISYVGASEFDRAMKSLLSNNEEVAKSAVSMLTKVVLNIVNNPQEEKYRRLKCSNQTFQKKIGSVSGGLDCIRTLGFHQEADEWVLTPTPEAWNHLVYCKDKLSKFSSLMQTVSNNDPPRPPIQPVAAPVAAPLPPALPLDIDTMQQLINAMMQLQQVPF